MDSISPNPDPETALLRQVITLGMLIKILLAVGGLLAGIGMYEVHQLDDLRNKASDLEVNVSALSIKVDQTQGELNRIKDTTDSSKGQMNEILENVKDIKTKLHR